MIGLAISLFSEGSIIWGLVALFIGTPIAIGLIYYSAVFICCFVDFSISCELFLYILLIPSNSGIDNLGHYLYFRI